MFRLSLVGLGCDVEEALEAEEKEEPKEGIELAVACVLCTCCWNRGLRRGKLLIVSAADIIDGLGGVIFCACRILYPLPFGSVRVFFGSNG